MMSATVPFDSADLTRRLGATAAEIQLVFRSRVDSTNDELRRLSRSGAPSWTVVVAEEQTAGRGRQGRHWHSARGLGLYLSVLVRSHAVAADAPRWTIAASVAACRACHGVGAEEVCIKWPNDLLYRDRKLAGMLTELRSSGERVEEVVIGSGFNVAHRGADFPEELRGRVTSLRGAGATPLRTRERLAAGYLLELRSQLELLQAGDWQAVAGSWHGLSPASRGRRVRVLGGSGEFVGVTCGLAPSGALQVEREDGSRVELHQGENVIDEEPGTCC